MLLLIECIIACIVFTAIMLPPVYKDPLSQIMSYPTAIRKRVESLEMYKNVINKAEKKHIARKIIAALLSTVILAVIAYFSGAKTFSSAFMHVFILFFSVNFYDMLVLDIGLFCHTKKAIIPGTEDMIDEYKKPWHHIKGFFIGILLGTLVALISGFYVFLFTGIL
ncbi:MAG: hypothetical protein R3Y36_02890 [Spirochaetales bacterium]